MGQWKTQCDPEREHGKKVTGPVLCGGGAGADYICGAERTENQAKAVFMEIVDNVFSRFNWKETNVQILKA